MLSVAKDYERAGGLREKKPPATDGGPLPSDAWRTRRKATHRGTTMKALCWHGSKDIRCDEVPDPQIEHPRTGGRADDDIRI